MFTLNITKAVSNNEVRLLWTLSFTKFFLLFDLCDVIEKDYAYTFSLWVANHEKVGLKVEEGW